MLATDERIAALRRFSRFYTREVGLLRAKLFESPFSLSEARVLYELAHHERLTASDIAQALHLDHGYLSRILRRFEQKGFLKRERLAHDKRQSALTLTAKGRKAFAPVDAYSRKNASDLLGKLVETDQERVVRAMETIETLLATPAPNADRAFELRPHRRGDMGWVVAQHGVIYGEEYGWDDGIEALTAEICANFLKNLDPAREACWIAEMDGKPVGSVFIVKESDDIARLRLLIVDPAARGLGVGKTLVDECISFSRKAGYRTIVLWTHAVLVGARKIYKNAGFKVTEEWVHDDFGKPEAAETWELAL